MFWDQMLNSVCVFVTFTQHYAIIGESSIMEKTAPFLSDLCRNQHKRDKDVINQSYSWGSL